MLGAGHSPSVAAKGAFPPWAEMRENLIRMRSAAACHTARPVLMTPTATMLLTELANGGHVTVECVVAASAEMDETVLRRLGELGFIPGEPVQLLRRGPGGREPLAVLIGGTMFAMRLLEAQCVQVRPLAS